MSNYNLGDVVMVVGKIDNRVRETLRSDIVKGTIEQFLIENQVSVILENGDLWVGHIREVVPTSEQE